ncbi:CRISPR-associated protein Cas8a1/Cst1, subtype I-B/TNEAP [Acetivibrio clariflavus DSM 19732]|uniref:CRISPR-associated protein Cas8a1/Cst1, subtype I-B/TNEAP n=1 Tax=Acetivibrio clariflavus (strain DSM 19732 / NBRC 101661 / EBR45) TaxID=720554 RepID=G8M1H2_ACECE|nr:CRISPR-associated protein Cas8a1/Cst1, subtype I-B/TNEAP [Acetivibrio clariflavus DSM 19732]
MSFIKIQLSDWLYNAGVIGLVNILKHANDQVDINGQEVTIKTNVLANFEAKYYKYFVDTYGKTMTFTKLINRIDKLLNIELDESKEKEIGDDIDFIKSKVSNNSAYKGIKDKIDLKKLEKPSKKVTSINKEILEELKYLLLENKKEILKSECIGYYDQKSKTSKAPNAIIDKYINTNMLDVGLGVNEVKEYLSNEEKLNFSCFQCGRGIQKIDKGLSFLNRMFFDTARKTSHVWNFVSDIDICPICKIVYYCVPAGFTTVFGNGIFVNYNQSVERAEKINLNIRHEILHSDESKRIYNAFGTMIRSLHEKINDSKKYDLADIQIVRCEDDKYKFNLLSKNVLYALYDSRDELNSLLNTGFQEVNTYFRIYDEVMKNLLNNVNLFILIHKVLVIKISSPKDAKYNESHIRNLIKINFKYMKGVGYMESTEKDIVKISSSAGYYLREAYKSKNSENKLNGICYRLLNALKTSNKSMFMDTILNCYLYTNKPVPTFITECLKDDNVFKTIGYAFVTGLIDGNKNENTDGGDN